MAKLAKTSSKSSNKNKKIEFKFFAPQAKEVYVGGCFNSWNPEKTPLKKKRNGNWDTSVKIPSGRYEYRYLVDGLWQNAQEPVECIPNSFGTWNCVMEIA